MVWQKLDDQFGIHRKVIRIPRAKRLEAVGLWTLALNYAGRHLTNGVIEEHELDEVLSRATVLRELVRVELWHEHGHVCDSVKCGEPAPAGGITIHDFFVHNPSRADVIAAREAERVRKASQRESKRSPSGTGAGRDPVSEHPVPVPVPDQADMTSSHGSALDSTANDLNPMARVQRLEDQAVIDAHRLRIKDMPGVRWLFEQIVGDALTFGQVIVIAEALIGAAKGVVESGDAYLRTVCKDTPANVRRAYDDLHVEAVR